jgi:ubiquinone/menaquinone biosynthesis C-methylase UbiE
VVASDIAPTGLAIAESKAKSLGLNNIEFKLHDMRSIPLANDCIDGVICIWVLHHGILADIKATIHEIHRILKPGGMVITDLSSVDTESYGIGKEIECNTFIGDKKDEEDVFHHYTTRQEVTGLFSAFRQYRIRLCTRFYTDEEGKEHFSRKFHVNAVK